MSFQPTQTWSEEAGREYSTHFTGENTETHGGTGKIRRELTSFSQLTSQIPCEMGIIVLILQM